MSGLQVTDCWQEVRYGETTVEIRVLSGAPTIGDRPFVLLADVQDVFPETVRLQVGRRAIGFMVDHDGNRVLPLRVEYQPGVVLEAVLSETQGSSTSLLALRSLPAQEQITMNTSIIINSHDSPAPLYPALDRIPAPEYSVSVRPPPFAVPLAPSQGLGDMASVIADTATATIEATAATAEAAAGAASPLSHSQRHRPQPISSELRERIFDTEDITPNELTDLKTTLDDILSETVELYESSTPRLFIILPKNAADWDPDDLYGNKVCLYFLCDCGEHTRGMSQDGRLGKADEHRIHLAGHPGYEIDSTYGFLAKYGQHMLALLQMFRYGVSSAGYEVPELKNLGTEQEIVHLPVMADGIEVAVFRAIAIIRKVLQHNGDKVTPTRSSPRASGASLRVQDQEAVATYLRNEDYSASYSTGTAAGLYRVVDGQGHAKWVCAMHYGAVERIVAAEVLHSYVSMNQAIYNYRKGSLYIKLVNSAFAQCFYGELSQLKCIKELRIHLPWSMSQRDFLNLYSALKQNAGIVSLTLHSSRSGSKINFLGKSKRADPILQQIMALPSLRSFTLGELDGFLARASALHWTSHLRSFSYVGHYSSSSQGNFLAAVFQNCPKLQELKLGCAVIQEAFVSVQETLDALDVLRQSQFRRLELTVSTNLNVLVEYDRGRPVSMDMCSELVQLPDFVYTYAVLRKLVVFDTVNITRKLPMSEPRLLGHSPQPYAHHDIGNDGRLLRTLLTTQPQLSELRLSCQPALFRTVYEFVQDTYRIQAREKWDPPLRSLVLVYGCCTLTSSDLKDPASMSLKLKSWQSTLGPELQELLNEFGWALVECDIEGNGGYSFSPPPATTLSADLFRKNLEQYSSGESRLERLRISYASIVPEYLKRLTSVIVDSSPCLEELSVVVRDHWSMDTIAHFSWAGWIRDVSSKITSLHFRSEANREMRVMERTCQVPFPKLQQFHFTMPTMRHLDAITFLHLLKHLERMMAVPNTEVALPLYSSASLSEVLGQLAEDVKAFFPLGYASYLYPSSTYSPFLATTPSPSSETQLSSLSYRQWSAPKTSPLLTCIRLEYISLGVLEWFKILDTIDLPALEELSLMGTNIMDQHILMMKGRLSPESSMTVEEEGQDSSNRQRHTGVRMKLLNLKNCHYITAEKKTQFTAWIDRYLDA